MSACCDWVRVVGPPDPPESTLLTLSLIRTCIYLLEQQQMSQAEKYERQRLQAIEELKSAAGRAAAEEAARLAAEHEAMLLAKREAEDKELRERAERAKKQAEEDRLRSQEEIKRQMNGTCACFASLKYFFASFIYF